LLLNAARESWLGDKENKVVFLLLCYYILLVLLEKSLKKLYRYRGTRSSGAFTCFRFSSKRKSSSKGRLFHFYLYIAGFFFDGNWTGARAAYIMKQ